MTFGVRHKDLGRGARQKGGVFSVSGEWWENQKVIPSDRKSTCLQNVCNHHLECMSFPFVLKWEQSRKKLPDSFWEDKDIMRVAAKTDCKVTWPETLASFGCWGSPFGEWDIRSGYLQVFGLQPEVSPGGQGDCSYLRCTETRLLERCLLVPCLMHVHPSIMASWVGHSGRMPCDGYNFTTQEWPGAERC